MSFFNEKNFDFIMATAVLLVLAIPVGIETSILATSSARALARFAGGSVSAWSWS
ncbi:hypothetical protein [Campylobacter sp.]|uniref:hypothetical protein n=1 Tax=Campylobacter sp. TaxID=205 RepID=UPI00360F2CFF